MTTIQIVAGVAGTVLAAVLPEAWRSGVRWRNRRRMRKWPQRIIRSRP